MKKILILTLTISIVLAACGTASETTTVANSTSSTSPITENDVQEPINATTTTTAEIEAAEPVVDTTQSPQQNLNSSTPLDFSFDIPTSIKIPSIGVDAIIEPVGNEANGEMVVPEAEDVGWWKFGSAINQTGSMVLAGHVDYNGVEGVFFNLRDLKKGDQIIVDGVTYEVDRIQRQDKNVIVDSGVFSNTTPHQLVLVTCGGDFDQSARSYVDNIVVWANPV